MKVVEIIIEWGDGPRLHRQVIRLNGGAVAFHQDTLGDGEVMCEVHGAQLVQSFDTRYVDKSTTLSAKVSMNLLEPKGLRPAYMQPGAKPRPKGWN